MDRFGSKPPPHIVAGPVYRMSNKSPKSILLYFQSRVIFLHDKVSCEVLPKGRKIICRRKQASTGDSHSFLMIPKPFLEICFGFAEYVPQ